MFSNFIAVACRDYVACSVCACRGCTSLHALLALAGATRVCMSNRFLCCEMSSQVSSVPVRAESLVVRLLAYVAHAQQTVAKQSYWVPVAKLLKPGPWAPT